MHTYIKYDKLKAIDFSVVLKLPRSRKRQLKADNECRAIFNRWNYYIDNNKTVYKGADNIHEFIINNSISIHAKTLLMDHDQFCTALAYGYPIIIEKECDNGYVIMLIVGYNKYKKEYIVKAPYALQDKICQTLIYISFDSIMIDVIDNCILYSKTDINKLLF